MDNFVEVKSIEEANMVDLKVYTFLDRVSGSRGTFVFKIRELKRK